MTDDEQRSLSSPTAYLTERLGELPSAADFHGYEQWWESEGGEISAAVDRGGTP